MPQYNYKRKISMKVLLFKIDPLPYNMVSQYKISNNKRIILQNQLYTSDMEKKCPLKNLTDIIHNLYNIQIISFKYIFFQCHFSCA